MKLQDYIHHYMGCKIQQEFITRTKNIELRIGTITGIDLDGTVPCCHVRFNYNSMVRLDSIKLILRKLEDATPEEIKEMRLIRCAHVNRIKKYAAVTKYLTSIGIDVFELIQNGLAIDPKTLK